MGWQGQVGRRVLRTQPEAAPGPAVCVRGITGCEKRSGTERVHTRTPAAALEVFLEFSKRQRISGHQGLSV